MAVLFDFDLMMVFFSGYCYQQQLIDFRICAFSEPWIAFTFHDHQQMYSFVVWIFCEVQVVILHPATATSFYCLDSQ